MSECLLTKVIDNKCDIVCDIIVIRIVIGSVIRIVIGSVIRIVVRSVIRGVNICTHRCSCKLKLAFQSFIFNS